MLTLLVNVAPLMKSETRTQLSLAPLRVAYMCWPEFSPQMTGGAGPSDGTMIRVSDRHWPTMEWEFFTTESTALV